MFIELNRVGMVPFEIWASLAIWTLIAGHILGNEIVDHLVRRSQ